MTRVRGTRARSDPLRDGANDRGEKVYIAAQSVDRRVLDAFKDTFVGYQVVLTRRVAPNAAALATRTDVNADADGGGALRRAWMPGGRRRPDVAANVAEPVPTHERCIAIRRYSTLRMFTRQLRATYGLTSARGFPSKLAGFGSVNLEQRRAALEEFFQSLLLTNAAAFATHGKGGAADALSTFVLHSVKSTASVWTRVRGRSSSATLSSRAQSTILRRPPLRRSFPPQALPLLPLLHDGRRCQRARRLYSQRCSKRLRCIDLFARARRSCCLSRQEVP